MNKYRQMMEEAYKQKRELDVAMYYEIQDVYKQAARELYQQYKNLPDGSFTKRSLALRRRELLRMSRGISKKIEGITAKGVSRAANFVALANIKYFDTVGDALMKKSGLRIGSGYRNIFTRVRDSAIMEIHKGGIYKDNKGLSARIWMDAAKMGMDMQSMLEVAIAKGQSAIDFAKDLEKYVDPEAMKPWDWGKVYPGTKKQVDYNAQRLARTSITHAHFLANKRSCAENPYIDAMHWELSEAHYYRQVRPYGADECDEYAEQDDYNLGEGNFPVDKTPLPHPHCLCTQWGVLVKDIDEIVDNLISWGNGELDDPQLDAAYREFWGEEPVLPEPERTKGRKVLKENLRPGELDGKLKVYENEIRNLPYEKAYVFTKNGAVFSFEGGAANVDIGGVDLKGAVITHNHPESYGEIGGSFSEDDFRFLQENPIIKELRAVDSEYDYWVKLLNEIDISLNQIYVEGLQLKMDIGDFDGDPKHYMCEVLKRKGYIDYERKNLDT